MSTDFDVRVDIAGLDELVGAMEDFGNTPEINKEILENVMRKTLEPMRKMAIQLAPRNKEGEVNRKSLHRRISIGTTRSRRHEAILGITRKTPYVWMGARAPHGHLIEIGHWARSRGPNRKGQDPIGGPRWVGPQPFIKPSFDAHKKSIPRLISKGIAPALRKQSRAYERDTKRAKPRRRTLRQFGGR